MAAYGLYTHIQSNKRRSVVLLIGLFFLVYVLVYAGALVGEALTTDAPIDVLMRRALTDAIYGAPFATIGTALWIWIAYKFHQKMIDAVTGGREVTRQEEPRLYTLLENLCISRGITTPKLKVIDDPSLNAFATGMNDKQYSITVTQGLLDRLDDNEVEAVLGHELTHIRNGDVRMLVIAVIIAGVVSFFAELMFRLVFQGGFRVRSSGGGKKGGGIAIAIADRGGAGRGGLDPVDRDPVCAVASARIPRRRGLSRAHQEPGRHDLGAAQDRGARRTRARQFGGDGDVRRQSAGRLLQPVRHPPVDRRARRHHRQAHGRPRSGTDRAAGFAAGRGPGRGSEPGRGGAGRPLGQFRRATLRRQAVPAAAAANRTGRTGRWPDHSGTLGTAEVARSLYRELPGALWISV